MAIQSLSDIVRSAQSAFDGGGGSVYIGATPPVDPGSNPLWCDLSGRMYVWDGAVWFEVSGRPGTDGATGANGTNGTNGTNGAPGVGVPAGGTAGQVLQKVDSDDFNTQWAAPSGGSSPGGASGSVQFNNAGALGGAEHVTIGSEGNLILSALDAKPTEPPADTIQVYGRSRAGESFIDVQSPNGRDFPLQPHFGVNRIGLWAPSTATAVTILGLPRSAVGTISHPTLASTNLSTSIARWRNTSAATANSVADERASATRIWRGNAAGLGGWKYINRISLALLPALSRAFFGCLASTAALSTTQDPNALTNCIGIGFVEGTDTNWQVLRNDASGAAVKTDLGASFPVSSLTNVYTLFIACPTNGSSIWVRVVEEVSGAVFEQEFTTDIPAATTFLSVRNYMNNGGTALACAYDCSGVYIETDY